jgi:hypothetical protein
MKRLIMCVTAGCLWIGIATAQNTKKRVGSGRTTKTAAKQAAAPARSLDTTVNLTSSGAYQARAAATRLYIADPTIRTFNNRVFSGAHIDGEKAIIGIPKLQTGVAHGHILFYPTSSATLGTNTGSGTVGTGTSLGNVGTGERVIGVNGKNPYAGPGMYGTRFY